MSDWLSHLDPNVTIALVVGLLTYLDHRFLSPNAKDKLASTLSEVLAFAGTVLDSMVAASPPGTTREQLEGQLWDALNTQLAHFGFDPKKLQPAVLAMAKALIADALSGHAAATPVTVTTLPLPLPITPPSSPGTVSATQTTTTI